MASCRGKDGGTVTTSYPFSLRSSRIFMRVFSCGVEVRIVLIRLSEKKFRLETFSAAQAFHRTSLKRRIVTWLATIPA
jgi:hypothetical protein